MKVVGLLTFVSFFLSFILKIKLKIHNKQVNSSSSEDGELSRPTPGFNWKHSSKTGRRRGVKASKVSSKLINNACNYSYVILSKHRYIKLRICTYIFFYGNIILTRLNKIVFGYLGRLFGMARNMLIVIALFP